MPRLGRVVPFSPKVRRETGAVSTVRELCPRDGGRATVKLELTPCHSPHTAMAPSLLEEKCSHLPLYPELDRVSEACLSRSGKNVEAKQGLMNSPLALLHSSDTSQNVGLH